MSRAWEFVTERLEGFEAIGVSGLGFRTLKLRV